MLPQSFSRRLQSRRGRPLVRGATAILLAALCLGTSSCTSQPDASNRTEGAQERSPAARATGAPVGADDDLATVSSWMAGSFTNLDQAERDPEFAPVRLEIWPIWPARSSATSTTWLYVEESRVGREDEPYRQRVYRLRRGDGGQIESEVFLLPSPSRFAGAWREPDPLAGLTPDSLTAREGCVLYLRRSDASTFRASTVGQKCPSAYRGSAYVESDVEISALGIELWNRGFDANGVQVWGATEGPYEFRRR